MDSYVFGAAFYYAMVVLFTIYMFLFAGPSVTKQIPYKIVSYCFMGADVALMYLYYKLSIHSRRKVEYTSFLSMLVLLNDPVSMLLLFILMVREKML